MDEEHQNLHVCLPDPPFSFIFKDPSCLPSHSSTKQENSSQPMLYHHLLPYISPHLCPSSPPPTCLHTSQLALYPLSLDFCGLPSSQLLCPLPHYYPIASYHSPDICTFAQSPSIFMCPMRFQLMEFHHHLREICPAISCSKPKGNCKGMCPISCYHSEQCFPSHRIEGMCPVRTDDAGEICPLRNENTCSLKNDDLQDMCPISWSEQCFLSDRLEDMCPIRTDGLGEVWPLRIDDPQGMFVISSYHTEQCFPSDHVEDMCPIRTDDAGEICQLRDEDTSNKMCPLRPDDPQDICPLQIEDYSQSALIPISEFWSLEKTSDLKCTFADRPGICTFPDSLPATFNNSTQCHITDIPEYEQNLTCPASTAYRPDFVGIALLLIATFTLLFLYWRKRKRMRLPPGPFSLPIVGHLHLFGPYPHRSLYDMSNKYGPLMYLWLGSRPIVVVSSAPIAREFLETHDHIFTSRPLTAAGQHLGYNFSGLTWAPAGPHWQKTRKLSRELLGPDQLKVFDCIMSEEVETVIRSVWNALYNDEDQLDISLRILAMVNNFFSRLFLGQKYYGKGTEGRVESFEYKMLMAELSHLTRAINLGDYIPCLKWMDVQGYDRRMKKVMKRVDVFLEEILEEHCQPRASKKNRGDTSVLDILLSVSRNNEISHLNREEVKALIVDLLTGGINATCATIEWAMSEILRNPTVMTKAQNELDMVVGKDRRLENSDLSKLQYLQAVVKEVLRLHPVCPLAILRESSEDCKVDGYYIPKEACLFVNAWAMGQDITAWVNPTEFFPERFLIESKIDLQGQHFQLIPFGSGSRMCPGMLLALSVVQFALASLIHCFGWSLPSKQNPENLDMKESQERVVSRATPLIAVPRARLPPHLF